MQFLGLVLADGVCKGVAELLVRERNSTVPVGWVAEDRRCRLQRRDRQWQHAAEGGGVDCDRHCREAASREHLGEQTSEGMPDYGGLVLQRPDDLGEVVGYLSNRLVCEDFRLGVGLLDGRGVIRPPGCQRRIAGLLEERGPAVPAAW